MKPEEMVDEIESIAAAHINALKKLKEEFAVENRKAEKFLEEVSHLPSDTYRAIQSSVDETSKELKSTSTILENNFVRLNSLLEKNTPEGIIDHFNARLNLLEHWKEHFVIAKRIVSCVLLIVILAALGIDSYFSYQYGLAGLNEIKAKLESDRLERDLIATTSEKFVAEKIKTKADVELVTWAMSREGNNAFLLSKASKTNIESLVFCKNGEKRGTIEERDGYKICFPQDDKGNSWGWFIP